ncbi:hypothetical protein ACFUOZ_16510 [Paenarthrobacter sp. NPDC057355]|uniref:hypothetical protein n=1 Tax=Paenarthrobacter sp. NPDC057355 TaxID=3346105 RepID=UPI003638358C
MTLNARPFGRLVIIMAPYENAAPGSLHAGVFAPQPLAEAGPVFFAFTVVIRFFVPEWTFGHGNHAPSDRFCSHQHDNFRIIPAALKELVGRQSRPARSERAGTALP